MKKVIRYFISIGSVMLLLHCAGFAQITASMSLEKDTILLGDQVNLKLSLQVPKDATSIQFPTIPDTFNSMEVLSRAKVDSIANKDYNLFEQKILITSFEEGIYKFPSWNVNYTDATGSVHSVAIAPIDLYVNTIEVDTTQVFKSIFEIEEEVAPDFMTQASAFIGDNKKMLIGIGIGLLLIVSALVAYFLLKKRKKKEVKITELPFIKARRLVMELEASKLWEQGRYKVYYSELSDIIKNYFEEQLSINANEMTTRDLLQLVKKSNNFRGIHVELRQILQISDLTKFAKGTPDDEDHITSVKNALRIIEHTQPQTTVNESNDQ